MGRPKKDITDEDRYKASNEYHLVYGRRPLKCVSCNIEITYNTKVKHLTSKKHLKSDFKLWKCDDICNAAMHKSNRVHHLQTEKHKRKECLTCESERNSEESEREECPTCSDSK